MKRVVKLIAVDNRYKDTSYPYRCIYHEGYGTYLTGQHIDPNDPVTTDNLTHDEMIGKDSLSAEKKKAFRYVINPLSVINLNNGQIFDLTLGKNGSPVNPKDFAEVNLLKHYGWFVAGSRAQVIPRKHYFYLHDEISEAEKRIETSDLEYKAEKYVREEVPEEGLRDIALVLNYKLKDFEVDPDKVSKVVLKDRILEACKKHPDTILEAKFDGSSEEVFILKLAYNGIIKRRGMDFYDGSKYIGQDLIAVRKFMKLEENAVLVSKWQRLLADKEGGLPKDPASLPKEDDPQSILFEELKDKSVEELKKYAGSKRYPKAEWGDMKDHKELIKYLLAKKG